MNAFIWRVLPLLLSLAACGAAGEAFARDDVAGPGAGAAPPAAATATSADTTAAADDPTLARERDWKLGDLEEPAVTIIEYGDFQ